jgi:hypothetical protein
MFAKEGVSPLIGTVLLISFGIAFTLIIVNIDFLNPCSNLVIEISENPEPCYDPEEMRISMVLEHKRGADLVGVSYRIYDGADFAENDFYEFSLKKNNVEKLGLPYNMQVDAKDIEKVTVNPIVRSSNKKKECKKPSVQIILFDVPFCGN